jgi:hypothetical protein
MASHWVDDQPNQATFIYYNHSHYIYGFWFNGMLNGFNAVRFDKVVIYGWFEFGSIKGRFLLYMSNIILRLSCKWDKLNNNWLKFKKAIFSVMNILMNISGCVIGHLLNKIGKR